MFQPATKILLPHLSKCSRSGPDQLQQMPSFFSSDLDKIKLETKLKTFIHIVDENKLE